MMPGWSCVKLEEGLWVEARRGLSLQKIGGQCNANVPRSNKGEFQPWSVPEQKHWYQVADD